MTMSETSELKKPVNLMLEKPTLKQYYRTRPIMMMKNWSIFSHPTFSAPQWLIIPICTTFITTGFLVLVVCCSTANRWALLISNDHSWEQYVGIWQDCLTENCWTDIFIWPALQTAQGFMITAVLSSFLLTIWLYGFFCTSTSLKMYCHLIFIALSFLTGTCLFIAIILVIFVLEKVNAAYSTYYIYLWPFYMLWIAFVLFLISCVLGSFSFKGPGQKKKRVTCLIRPELTAGSEFLSKTTFSKTSALPKTKDEVTYPSMLQKKHSSLVNWTTDNDIYGAFGDL